MQYPVAELTQPVLVPFGHPARDREQSGEQGPAATVQDRLDALFIAAKVGLDRSDRVEQSLRSAGHAIGRDM